MGVPQVNHHAKSLECAECLEGKSENPSTFSLLERALLDEDWMHLFDSAHLLTTTTRYRRPHHQ